jgi:hypothetical protein
MDENYIAPPLCYLGAMSLSRRRFFEQFMRPGKKSPEERKVRYEMMEEYVRTQVVPPDSPLTARQEAELFNALRSALEETDDEELFSVVLHFKVEEVVDRQLRKWREEPR